MPWADMMVSALGVLGWTPEVFRKSTINEYTSAMKGHLLAKGVELKPSVSKEEVDAAWAEHRKRMRKASEIGVHENG